MDNQGLLVEINLLKISVEIDHSITLIVFNDKLSLNCL